MDIDVFIKGEIVDLCVPTIDFAKNSAWYSWFNDEKITQHLEQGLFPNTPEKQVEFLSNVTDNRLVLIVTNKTIPLGVVSLSNINYFKKTAELAVVINNKLDKRNSPYIALEASALITNHGFLKFGLNRIEAGQAIALSAWQQRLELIGYRLEGIKKNGFIKGITITDSFFIASTKDDFEKICSIRGKLWDSLDLMKNRIQSIKKIISMSDQLSSYLLEKENYYYNEIYNL